MKIYRFIALLLTVVLLVPLTACTENTPVDTWDGSIAESFSGGDGSESSPYEISSCAELAYLAKSTNEGNDYAGKHFSLKSNLDLNNLEWTPIGNITYSFSGLFYGNKHTISNLKITKGFVVAEEDTNGDIANYTTGLFGSCIDSVINGIAIDKAEISIQSDISQNIVMGSVVVGKITAESSSEISDVHVINACITCNFEQSPNGLAIGGIAGYLHGKDNSSFTLKNVDSEVTISIADGRGGNNDIGGIIGASGTKNLFNVSNCASDLSVKIDTENCYNQHNYFGAFGSVVISNNMASISNVFSKIKINKIHDIYHGYPAYNANAIIGGTYHSKQSDGTVIGGYNFKNCFGFIEQLNEVTEESVKSTQLYELPKHAVYTETNCKATDTLPENHGFDPEIWDLDDLSNPKIK